MAADTEVDGGDSSRVLNEGNILISEGLVVVRCGVNSTGSIEVHADTHTYIARIHAYQ